MSACEEEGHYLVAKSDDTLHQMYYDDMNNMEVLDKMSFI